MFAGFLPDEALRESSYEKLLPPLVHELRRKVQVWRDSGYEGGGPIPVFIYLTGGLNANI